MTRIITQKGYDFPFDWANLNSYRDSNAYRKEIYLKSKDPVVDNLIVLFYSLFGDSKSNLIVYNKSWWDFCLDTWDISQDENNYGLKGKSLETQEYLKLLMESRIESNYSGCCTCNNWDKFLRVILECLISHKAPYSPLFCDVENEYFFYFHYTGSIGLYYRENNNAIDKVLFNGKDKYILES